MHSDGIAMEKLLHLMEIMIISDGHVDRIRTRQITSIESMMHN